MRSGNCERRSAGARLPRCWAAGALTTPLGVAILIHIDARLYATVLGAIVVGYGGYALLRRQGRPVRGAAWHDLLAGGLGGVMPADSSGAPGLVRDHLVLDARLGQGASSAPSFSPSSWRCSS